MAKQAGDYFIEGTIDDVTYYRMDGEYYVRMKSTLTAKKFWKSKAFEGSRKSCYRFAEGNKLASRLYSLIAEDKKNYKLFCFLKKKAIQLLKEGKSLTDAQGTLMEYTKDFRLPEVKTNKRTNTYSILLSKQAKRSAEWENLINPIKKYGRPVLFISFPKTSTVRALFNNTTIQGRKS